MAILSLITIKTYYTAFHYPSYEPNLSFLAQLGAQLQAFFKVVLRKKNSSWLQAIKRYRGLEFSTLIHIYMSTKFYRNPKRWG
jgi:hypothetical protein